jgi:hypothetical protein
MLIAKNIIMIRQNQNSWWKCSSKFTKIGQNMNLNSRIRHNCIEIVKTGQKIIAVCPKSFMVATHLSNFRPKLLEISQILWRNVCCRNSRPNLCYAPVELNEDVVHDERASSSSSTLLSATPNTL